MSKNLGFIKLLFTFLLIRGIHGESCSVINKVTLNNYPSSKIGEQKWANGCPTGKYIKAVWAKLPTEHFQKIKCCDGTSDNSLSWELRDLGYFSGGEGNLTKQWNVQCQSNAIITGVRYFEPPNINPQIVSARILNGVRCSALKYQIVDPEDCTILDFTQRVTNPNNFKPMSDKQWQHQCPDGYAMVGLYDKPGNYFVNIQKAKCCRVRGVNFEPGWVSDFEHHFSNLSQSTEDDGQFYPSKQSDEPMYALSPMIMRNGTNLKTFRIMTPAFADQKAFCFSVYYTFMGRDLGFKIKLVNSDKTLELTTVSGANAKYFGRRYNIKTYVKSEKTSQLYLDASITHGQITFSKFEVLDSKSCDDVNQCTPALKDCPINEKCLPSGPQGLLKCICDTERGFKRNVSNACVCQDSKATPKDGYCVQNNFKTTTQKPTNGASKGGGGGGGGEGVKTDAPTVPPSEARPTDPYVQRGSKIEKNSSPWTYVTAGASSIIVVFILISGSYFGWRKMYTRQKNLNSHSMGNINLTSITNSTTLSRSLTSVAYDNDEHRPPLYRPYMDSLGYIENASSPHDTESLFLSSTQITGSIEDAGCGMLSTTPEHLPFCIDVETGNPIYTRINRKTTLDGNANEDDVECPDENANTRRERFKRISFEQDKDEDVFAMEIDNRRPSTITLLQPNYGDSSDETDQSDGEDESVPVERFLVPGDDEEELLLGLNELPPESVNVSSKIIGQGAFGLVKLGDLYSTYGTSKVAVKMLKSRPGTQITQCDRVKFYQEAAIMSQFENDNVIALFGVLVGKRPCMVIEHMARGNLWKYLNMIRRAREKENVTDISRKLHGLFLQMARDIASGMTYLASLDFVHRDLACRNILLDNKWRCKISDFGLSRHFLKDDHYYTSKGGQIPVKWTAPEALNYKRYSTKSDVWSFGIVLWEIWSLGKRPYGNWDNDRVLKEVCENKYRLPSPEQTPILIYRLMLDCWCNDKNDRPNFSKILYCLKHKDDQILGSKKRIERTRSITFSFDSEMAEEDEREEEGSHENQACRTE
eukprot:TCONS_00071709-protein